MSPTTQRQLAAYNQHLLGELSTLLLELPAAVYTLPIPNYSQASVGKHFRHIIEFYECLLKGYPCGAINYDARERNPLYENSPVDAADACRTLAETMHELTPGSNLTLQINFDPSQADSAMPVSTTFLRELAYVYEHTVHHLALIRLALGLLAPDFAVPATLGVAPATLRVQQH
jgi:uncharacterized damage-inducible protein DinB